MSSHRQKLAIYVAYFTCSSMLLPPCAHLLFAENVDVTLSKLQKHKLPLHPFILSSCLVFFLASKNEQWGNLLLS